MMPPNIVVVGCGSVGKRHAANLHTLGCRIAGVDARLDRLEEAAARIPLHGTSASLGEMLARESFDAAVIATPPSLHLEHGEACLAAGLPLLLEKPIAPTLSEASRFLDLAERGGAPPVLLGYTFRWWEPVLRLRQLVDERCVGRLIRVQMVMAAHLADWHPWEPYQDFFMAKRAEGGGALLDESHFLDLLLWIFGRPRELSATIERLSDLEIDCDDNVEISALLSDGVRVSIHLDLYARPHERSIRVVGTQGTIEWNNEVNAVRVYGKTSTWTTESFACERNDMFVAEAAHFLDVIAGREKPACTLRDGCRVLELVQAARVSHHDRQVVALKPSDFG